MILPDPTMKLIGWAASCAGEALVDRAVKRTASRLKARMLNAAKAKAAAVRLPVRRTQGTADAR